MASPSQTNGHGDAGKERRPLIFHGMIVSSFAPDTLSILPSALLVVLPSGRVHSLAPVVTRDKVPEFIETLFPFGSPTSFDTPLTAFSEQDVVYLSPTQFIMPGFVDTHNHAAQWSQRGLGQGMHLINWLEEITFATEARFADPAYAKKTYAACVTGMLRQGITTAAYYGSLHGEATRVLIDECLGQGQRALVGKCNMDRGAPGWYRDGSVDESVRATRECIAHARNVDPESRLVRYVITPRFAISCSDPLLRSLGDLANENQDLPIQTHFDEAAGEVRATLSLFPSFRNEAELYASFDLLTPRTILAHCTRMTDYETERIRDAGCGIAHCPTANMTVGGGFMAAPVTAWLRRFHMEKVGLGTDIGGGYAPGILDAMRHARLASYARAAMERGDQRDRDCAESGLKLEEMLYLATLGGARVLGLGAEVGSFGDGKKFDALVVDMGEHRGGIGAPVEDCDGGRRVLEKFVMTGDDRNIAAVFVEGRLVAGCVPWG